ncbi:hypothetical protein XELAEV_18027434mg [Xenopus laevis]|nr:hypothetical protein XELAEV_18027434mg [Xenopus laevis]
MKSALPPPDVSIPKSQKKFEINKKSWSKYSMGLPVNEATNIKSIPARDTNSKATEHAIDIPISPVKTESAQPLQGSLSKSTKGYFVKSYQINLDKVAKVKSVMPLIGNKPAVCPSKNLLSSQKKPTPTKNIKPTKKSKKKQRIQVQNISCRVEVPYRQSKLHPSRQCKKNYVNIWSILKPFNRRSRRHKIQHHCQIKPAWRYKCRNQIMASTVHEIINSQFVKNLRSSASPALIHNILNCSYKIQKTAQPWTMRLEKEAIVNYKNLKLENDKKKVRVSDCELFTSSENIWLAGVCREVCTRDSEECWPLLVKCLHKHPDSTLVQATRHRSFFLRKEGYIYTLCKDHAYYTQLQFLMDITDTVYAELLVHTNKETVIVPVWIDFDFLEKAKEKLERFYTVNVLPYLQKNEDCKRRPQHHKNFNEA